MTPDYSIVIPAYNEAEYLPATLQSVAAAMRAVQPLQGEVVVVDNNSSDATAKVAATHGARVVFEPYNQIARARNCGARAAEGRLLIFLDADTYLSRELLQAALERLQMGTCCGGGAVVKFDDHENALSRLFLRLWTFISIKRRLAAGCFVFATREMFDAIGGFSEQVYASEEIWFSRNADRWARRHGCHFCIITDTAVISSGRKGLWFNSLQQVALIAMMLLFPFFVRFRFMCGFWYRRPVK